jgi:hypothetical protein
MHANLSVPRPPATATGLRAAALTLMLWLGAPAALHAQEGRGFAELRVSVLPGASGKAWQLVERLRPSLTTEVTPHVKLVATIEAGLRQGRDLNQELQRTLQNSELGPLLEAAQCEFPQPANRLLRIDGAEDYLSVDRLYFDAYSDLGDVRVGRQALNWGSAQFFNPTDPFPQVLLAEPWRPRRGVNALKVSVPFGERHDVIGVLAADDAFTTARAAGRIRFNWLETDWALVGAYRGGQNNGLVGVDIRGTLELGYWVEAAYIVGANPHEELSVGLDYSFPILERAVLFAQYYRNGSGSTDPAAYARTASFTGFTPPICQGVSLPFSQTGQRDPFAPFTMGRDYLIAGAALTILEELTSTASLVQNLNDGTGLLVPSVTYTALDWLDLSLSAQIPFALSHGGEFKPSRRQLRITVPTPDGGDANVDLSGLSPDATITFWSRASF